jgi:Mg2+-importing ATPase
VKSRPSRGVALTAITIVGIALLMPYMPFAEEAGFVPLPPYILGVLACITAAYLVVAEIAKRFYAHLEERRK